MVIKINPFNPNSPVHPGMFTGRLQEILKLESYLFQTIAEQPSNFLITGERGIGKTSLMNYLTFIARGLMSVDDKNLKFLVIDTVIDQSTTKFGLIKKIELGIQKELSKTEKAKAILKDAWEFIQRIETAGFRVHPSERSEIEETLLENFVYSLYEIVNKITEKNASDTFSSRYDGVLILIDEADNSSPELGLGSFLKLFAEGLQRQNCNRVLIGLVGLTELRNVLRESHPSSLRIFNEIELDRLSNEDVSLVIDRCLDKANEKNEIKVSIDDEARSYLIGFSEGYPHFIQQFGYSAFETNSDEVISENDVILGAVGKGGALDLIGDRYYRDNFYNKIQKESYRQVLRIMAENLDGWVKKSEIREKFKGKDSVLSNAIKALRDRHIILSKEGSRGIYRLQHKGFALWIKIYTTDPSQLQQTLETTNGNKDA